MTTAILLLTISVFILVAVAAIFANWINKLIKENWKVKNDYIIKCEQLDISDKVAKNHLEIMQAQDAKIISLQQLLQNHNLLPGGVMEN